MKPLIAMISYQSDDFGASELLHEELALRGLSVVHDRCTFPTGTRIAHEMAEAVQRCDAFVAYLTPSSLYLSKPPGSPRPAVDGEFKPAMDRRARATAAASADPAVRPVIVPLMHGLGDPRTEGPEAVRKATGKDVATLWVPVLDQTTSGITNAEAAVIGRHVLNALLQPGGDADSEELTAIEMAITTRGEGQPSSFLSIDGTNLLGGEGSRPGSTEDWHRFLVALRDLQAVLAAWTTERTLRLRVKAHLSVALTVGRVFNQAAGWRPIIQGRFGDVAPSTAESHPQLQTALESYSMPGDLFVELDLLGVGVSDLASSVAADLTNPLSGRLCVWRDGDADLSSEDVAAMASGTAAQIRKAAFALRPERIHIFCAAPVEYGVLVGRQLTSLHADLCFYERDGARYVPSLVIERTVP